MTFLFDNEIKEKVSALDPKFREKINELFMAMHKSISMLYDAAIHDEKTGLYNNKFFETVLDMEIEKARRKKEKLSLVVIDVDHFKRMNDTYGHLKADEMLAGLAKAITGVIRKSDVAARFGGEEFFILLPETSIEKAKKFAGRLKSAIHGNKFLKKYKLTVSGGITQYKDKENKLKFKTRADKALYVAKEGGRDRFEVLK
ncbi:MAG TPA: GGDEF domain-containing protein [Candidatus Omnitrophota bacterium]|nr:GGDEF domain-containing protein [Candidatus Omnitrophota bacterium]